jgi:hypothetical protein
MAGRFGVTIRGGGVAFATGLVGAGAGLAESFCERRGGGFLSGVLAAAIFLVLGAVDVVDGEAGTAVHLGFDWMEAERSLPGAAHVGFSFIAVAGGGVEVLVNDAGGGFEEADGEGRFFHAFEGSGEGFKVGDFAGHEELEGVDCAGIVGVVDEAFVDDFGASFGGDIAAEIDVEFAGNFEVVGSPGIALRVVESDAAAPCDGDERICFGGFAIGLERLEVHADEGANDFEMAEFFGADVEEEIAAGEVVDTVPTLDGVLHGGGEFSVGTAELFEEEVAEFDIGSTDVDGVHEFFNVVVHRGTSGGVSIVR